MCNRSCFQWRYVGGNNWGVCADGKGKVGFYDEKIFVTAESLFAGWMRTPRGVSRLCRHFNRSWYLSILFGNGGYHKIMPYPTLRVCHGGYHKIIPYPTLRVCPTNTVSYKTVTICTVLQTSQRASWGKSFYQLLALRFVLKNSLAHFQRHIFP